MMLFRKKPDPTLYCPANLLARDLTGRTYLITGGTQGFGKATAEALVKQGATVVIAVRRLKVGQEVAAELTASGPGSCVAEPLDLASLASVKSFAEKFIERHSQLDCLIENAAVCLVGNEPTVDGFQPSLGINFYGHVLLRHLLTPLLVSSAPSRVVVLGSSLHDRLFDQRPTVLDLSEGVDPKYLGFSTAVKQPSLEMWMAYARSKLANVMSANAWARTLGPHGVTVVSVHPGVDTSTGLFAPAPVLAKLMGWFSSFTGVQTTWQSIQTGLYCALEEPGKLEKGAFYAQHYLAGFRDGSTGGWPLKSPNPLMNEKDCDRLDALSRECLGLPPPPSAKKAMSGAAGELNVDPTPSAAEMM